MENKEENKRHKACVRNLCSILISDTTRVPTSIINIGIIESNVNGGTTTGTT